MGGGGGDKVKETEQEKALSEVAVGRYNRYQTRFRNFENKFIQDVGGDTGAKENRVAGQIGADIAQRTAVSVPGGVDPSRVGSNKGAIETGEAAAKAQVSGKNAVKNQQVQGLQAAINIGSGQGSTAQLGMEGIAESATWEAISDAETAFNRRQSYADAIGSLAGTATAIGVNSAPKGVNPGYFETGKAPTAGQEFMLPIGGKK